MTFSIIIPLFNKERTIADSLGSVLRQNCQDFEIVVVNDGSSDQSLAAAESVEDSRISIFSTENHGPSSARNFGIRKASGTWVIFLDADDILAPGALNNFGTAIKEAGSYDIVYATTIFNRKGVTSRFPRESLRGTIRNPYKEAFFRRQ